MAENVAENWGSATLEKAERNVELTGESEDALVLFCHGEELREPVVAYGPFVMNTEDEIREAYAEYQAGKFGRV